MDGMGKGKKSEIKINKYKSELKSFYSHMPPIFFIFSVENEDFENVCVLSKIVVVFHFPLYFYNKLNQKILRFLPFFPPFYLVFSMIQTKCSKISTLAMHETVGLFIFVCGLHLVFPLFCFSVNFSLPDKEKTMNGMAQCLI